MLLRKLAKGGMAELFLALQRSVAGFEKLVVIKRILPHIHQDRSFVDMLLHEARVAATLSHPNIVQVFDVGEVDGTYFIAMEHVHGEDIRTISRQMRQKGSGDFPREHAIGILLGICAGLAYAHEKRDLDGSALNIVHRDVSPQNVVVTFSGDIKIIDFGIAQTDGKLHPDTKSGKLKGKVPYMSPEQARGEELDARSDIFAAGVMLFELTTGRRLFKTASEYETLKLICEREYPTPSRVVDDYPPELEKIVMRALAKDKAERFQTAGEMQAALEDFVRRERVIVSTIALQRFMHALFEEKLASQEEALLHGRQLAEAIEPAAAASKAASANGAPQVEAPASEKEFGGAHLSMPAASHTVTSVMPRGGKRMMAFVGTAVLTVTVGWLGSQFFVSPPRPAKQLTSPQTSAPQASAPQTSAPQTPGPRPQETVGSGEASEISPLAHPAPQPDGSAAPHPASTKAQHAGTSGKLNVAAAGGWCDVAIDGRSFGPTPIAAIELPAGLHKVTCTPAGGKVQSASIRVPVAGVARHRFTL